MKYNSLTITEKIVKPKIVAIFLKTRRLFSVIFSVHFSENYNILTILIVQNSQYYSMSTAFVHHLEVIS